MKDKGVLVNSNNISSSYGTDLVDELTKILSEQIASAIDKDVVKTLGFGVRNLRRKDSIKKIYKKCL